MNTHEIHSSAPIDNLALIGRIIRFLIGGAMYAAGWYVIVYLGHVLYGITVSLISSYPLMTAMLGWDPIYQLTGSRKRSKDK